MSNKDFVYISQYPDAVRYTCDKNFLVRLRAMLDRNMSRLGYKTNDKKFDALMDSLDKAEDSLFKSREEIPAPFDHHAHSQQVYTEPRKPLFFTEDGKPVYEGDEYWWVCVRGNEDEKVICCDSEWQQGSQKASEHSCTDKNYVLFSTESAMKEWLLMNKPCLSVEDFIGLWRSENVRESPLIDDIKELAKSKINNQ